MGDNAKKTTIAIARPLCRTTRIHNGIEYRCTKHEGHEMEVGNEECVARAQEYADKVPDWEVIGLATKPLLEWMVANEITVGAARADIARRCLVRMYLAQTPRPGLAKRAPVS